MITKTSLKLINASGNEGDYVTLKDSVLTLSAVDDANKRFVVGGSFDVDTGTLTLQLANSDVLLVYGFLTLSGEFDASKRGPMGSVGEAGIDGKRGLDGDRGRQGGRGDKGPTGSIGSIGLPGKRGPKGIVGDMGKPGNEGNEGAPGEKGEIGEQGIIGSIGAVGASGISGPRGRGLYSVACVEDTLVFTFNDGTQKKVGLRRRGPNEIPMPSTTNKPPKYWNIPNPNRDPEKQISAIIPKYGAYSFGLTVQDAYSHLSSNLEPLSDKIITLGLAEGLYGYVLMPTTLASHIAFQQVDDAGNSVLFPGGWDGAKWLENTTDFSARGPLTDVVDGITWILYRTDFPGLGTIKYKLTW